MSEEFQPTDASKATTVIFLAITCNHLHRRLGNSVFLRRYTLCASFSIPFRVNSFNSFEKCLQWEFCERCHLLLQESLFVAPLVPNNTRNNSVLSVCAGEDKALAVSSLIKIDFYYGSHLSQSHLWVLDKLVNTLRSVLCVLRGFNAQEISLLTSESKRSVHNTSCFFLHNWLYKW